MQNAKKGKLKVINRAKLKIGIVVSQFNEGITGKMIEGALDVLIKNKVKKSNIKIVRVPGSFEIPIACQRLAQMEKYDALIALGCVIKGETDHFYYIAGEASRGIMNVMLKFDIPIGFGVITTNNLKQAQARSRGRHDKGREAAEAALAMVWQEES
ncbi:MAG: 6,7-dimethyl-8-ribityllumazine synthase [Candidatus Moranbacteria bacterium CG_4_10_14_3_um_filter_44_15]|nr:MAG: 6,7-dimethyl-8-ribityllumazine synthase [Candidatus Moranbacteria bacterium CG06_land_8_20_14_3_00_43_56]PIV83570.1 MAG: 6,7-dimethyl-8-ribityllumazine synthase [Candidatus Moranbacteria bacterium CG17_big_fil_post_rev_8_21_14_2_50_44_12]PIW93594.1 MAG: 6,7-dimethyl-8-ribityllumazine synthase [Candidatus Moranbacteria bacterium CG_4_8_14_3_um_filter_43_15]PIX91035.1 MAG: 6,7-dimethyl-8-ribityllumazine synthase [Candidatus Moranbacteria bacterium CG_4_10_14_3_um_filter_44_15]PJA86098.1 M